MYALGKQQLEGGAKAGGAKVMAAAVVAFCVAIGLGGCEPGPGGPPATPTTTRPGVDPGGPPTTYSVTETGPFPEESTPAPSSTATRVERARRAREILETCLEGELTFRPPSPMRQGETREFVLHLTMGDPGAGHEEKIPGSNPVETRAPIVCEEMRADLSGPGMDIQRAGNPDGEMLVPEQGVAEWSWWITPRDWGRKTMTLQLFATAEDGPDLSLETFREDIQVEIELGYLLNAVVKDWAQPLGLTIPVLIGAIGAVLVWSRSKKRKAKHAAGTAPKE
ncbi:hypothetical protein [Arthrobacter sp. ISL-72]|uniref:hypothetical protein n=1 Tax=Arthrobacter sp. ISL-72 TaxID=2819114 RepID=UPI001BE79C71|nr:hypothetical protein [Arthrobacter sp. ISL-72]MBT2596149.1 hypothetical protein [Arthrobacter sp. ISL-72]